MRKLTLADRMHLFEHPLKKKWTREFGDYMNECTRDLEYIEPDGIFILAMECVDNSMMVGGAIGLVVGIAGTALVFLVRKARKAKKEETKEEKSEEEA